CLRSSPLPVGRWRAGGTRQAAWALLQEQRPGRTEGQGEGSSHRAASFHPGILLDMSAHPNPLPPGEGARKRVGELRARPYNFLSRSQASEGMALAFQALDELHRDRRLPTFAELEEIATNPHAIEGFHEWCQRTRRFALWTREAVDAL